ncbi:hypothetical protein ED312_05490 [Sinomicrobium pectinilyticum]|uniref:Uncharacterized protein n=1 Tax=Sinomicrobium pectinilyticum TaxID=1084421 RepID=A0A3N0ERV4_SINP1|nr:hypothetical protein ED312_05490 [Sinomicrobium pectinilyticum]
MKELGSYDTKMHKETWSFTKRDGLKKVTGYKLQVAVPERSQRVVLQARTKAAECPELRSGCTEAPAKL